MGGGCTDGQSAVAVLVGWIQLVDGRDQTLLDFIDEHQKEEAVAPVVGEVGHSARWEEGLQPFEHHLLGSRLSEPCGRDKRGEEGAVEEGGERWRKRLALFYTH